MATIYSKLMTIQSTLKAPKGQYNSFGKYKYRSCEDVLEAVKPLLAQHDCALVISDDIVMLGDRIYVKATARLFSGDESIESSAYAREEDTKKGMDSSQVTGAASSYARKYALNGLFCIDDTKDSDATNTGEASQPNILTEALKAISEAKTMEDLKAAWSKYQSCQSNEKFVKAKDMKKAAIASGL